MKIILLEFVDEAAAFLDRYGRDFLSAKDTLTVCLHPKARAFLKKKGLEAKDTLDYFDNDAQHRIILKSEQLTERIVREMSFCDEFGISKGYTEAVTHHLRLYINHFLWIIEILAGIKNRHAISAIHCAVPAAGPKMYTRQAYIQDSERFLGFLAGDFCGTHNIDFHGLSLNIKKPGFFSAGAAAVARRCAEILALGEYNLLVGKKSVSGKSIVVPALSYRMDSVLQDLRKRHPDVYCFMVWQGKRGLKQELSKVYLSLANLIKKFKNKHTVDAVVHLDLLAAFFKQDRGQQAKINEQFDKIIGLFKAELSGACVYNRVSFRTYLEAKIEKGLRREIVVLQHATKVLNEVLRKIKPDLLMSMYSVGIYYMMGELSRIQGFASLSISHGTHVPANNEFEKIENYRLATSVILNTYGSVAVQTPWAQRFLDYYKDERPRIFSGPLLYSETRKDTREKKRREILGACGKGKIVVYATTQKGRHGMRFHIAETLDEYISALADIAVAVNSLENAYFVIRPHPACDISREEFRQLLPASQKTLIMDTGAFSEVLSAADLLISYSSTCLEEALQNEIPVVLFDKWRRYNHFNVPETRSAESTDRQAVYYITSPEVMAGGMGKILSRFDKDALTESDLAYHRYPKGFKSNFFAFVDRSLKQGGSA